jgi:hypothetical protein
LSVCHPAAELRGAWCEVWGKIVEGRHKVMFHDQLRSKRDQCAFPVPPPRESRERNDNPESREEATGTSAVCKPRLPSIILIPTRSIIVKTLKSLIYALMLLKTTFSSAQGDAGLMKTRGCTDARFIPVPLIVRAHKSGRSPSFGRSYEQRLINHDKGPCSDYSVVECNIGIRELKLCSKFRLFHRQV